MSNSYSITRATGDLIAELLGEEPATSVSSRDGLTPRQVVYVKVTGSDGGSGRWPCVASQQKADGTWSDFATAGYARPSAGSSYSMAIGTPYLALRIGDWTDGKPQWSALTIRVYCDGSGNLVVG